MTSVKNNKLPSLKVYQTAESAAYRLAEEILDYSAKTIQEKEKCVWAMSGGSSIIKLYEAMKHLKKMNDSFWKHLIVCWVDERHVPHEHSESNYGNACRCFWDQIYGTRLVPVPYHPSLEKSAIEYQKNLSDYGIGQAREIDILILGMGADGHTASLFPNMNKNGEWDSEKHIITSRHKGTERISLNFSLLNRSGKIRFLAYGAEKGVTFKRAHDSMNRDIYPFLGIKNHHSKFFVDQRFFDSTQIQTIKS